MDSFAINVNPELHTTSCGDIPVDTCFCGVGRYISDSALADSVVIEMTSSVAIIVVADVFEFIDVKSVKIILTIVRHFANFKIKTNDGKHEICICFYFI